MENTGVQPSVQPRPSVSSSTPVSSSGSKLNFWMISTVVLGIAVLVLLFFMFRGGLTGNVVLSQDEIGQQGVSFINQQLLQGSGNVTLDSVDDKGSFYQVNVNFNGNKVPAYFSKDGKYFLGTQVAPTSGVASNTNTNSSTNTPSTPTQVVKSDKPKVQAFIFSYCPYGLQFEKALLPVYNLLKNKADIDIVAIGAMHGEFEHVESLRQISIEQLYGRDKLFAYLSQFDINSNIGSCSGDAACLDKYIPTIFANLSIDKAKIDDYMKTKAEAIYTQQGDAASALGVSGSPTFVINGAEVQVGRTPDAIKTAVCDAFNTKPSECSQNLSTSASSPGFGADAGSSTGASCG